MAESLYRKSVILKDWNIHENHLGLKAPMEANHKQISFKNKESYLTLTSDSKEDINNKLSTLHKNILSDRARTLKEVPKYRIINSKKIRIQ